MLAHWFRRRVRQLRRFFEGFLVGDRAWGAARLLIIVLVFLLFLFLVSFLWERAALQNWVDRLKSLPFLEYIPQTFFLFLVSLFHLSSLRYLLIPLSALILAILVGARYVQDIYELKSYRVALQYLIASMFGVFYPILVIEDGKRLIRPGEENSLDVIGGPGYVVIRPGSVVLFEHLDNPSNVRAEGTHFISRFETIKEIASLQDQHGYIDRLAAVTKDGVVVAAKDIHYRYRLYASRKLGSDSNRSPRVPYPYSVQAVRNMAYNRVVRQDGLTPWADAVRILFEGEIQQYIRQNQVDQVTAPRRADADPRLDIRRMYQSPGFRERFRRAGAELLWCGIGHFEVENPVVNDQRIATWQAGWRGDARLVRAYSEGIEQAYKELGRAQAQAEILNSIFYGLNELSLQPGNEDKRLDDLFLLRVAQLLEAMGDEARENLKRLEEGDDG